LRYQSDTIGKYGLGFDGTNFQLLPKKTACLAQDACGVPAEKPRVRLSDLQASQSACSNAWRRMLLKMFNQISSHHQD
jgi:hypothetical protein